MLKLKIGDNYLITTNKDFEMKEFIVYTMSCFTGHNKTLLGLNVVNLVVNGTDNTMTDYLKALRESTPQELYVLIKIEDMSGGHITDEMKAMVKRCILLISETCPNTKIYIVKMGRELGSREYKLGESIYDALILDEKNILHHLDKLDEYKMFSNRYKAIPSELKVINENIKKMSKETKVCDRKITAADLGYLNLLDDIKLEGQDLILQIKPLPIYPSEPFGKCIDLTTFKNNPYLVKATKYLYQGYHFGMVGTRIRVNPQFRPEFLETMDHQFDDMFKRSNWSSIGYLHFGQGHLCGGEFNDVMAHTSEHGLEYYFICLKQYITTANMRDYAGKKVWWYPIYDDEGNMVYCAGLDIMRDELLRCNIPDKEKDEIRDMTCAEFQEWRLRHGIKFSDMNFRITSDSISSYSGKEDMFAKYCKEYDHDFYNILLEKGAI